MRIGTRGSVLALAQAGAVADALAVETEIVTIKTSGDSRASALGDKSRFVKEIEDALLAGDIDLAVHSAKDLPGELPDGLTIAAVPVGEDPRDALIGAASLDELPELARVGTSSLRRKSQLHAIRPDLEVAALRGNVDTRLRKQAAGEYEAIVLALAGLRRLGRADEAESVLDARRFVPAAGQGMLAIEARAGDGGSIDAAAVLEHPSSRVRLECERAIVARLNATCHTPVGASTELDGQRLLAFAYVGLPDGSEWIVDSVEGDSGAPAEVGETLAERMLSAGARRLLAEAKAGS